MKSNVRYLPERGLPVSKVLVTRIKRPGKMQDELTRRRRLNAGKCPTHGLALCQSGCGPEGEDIVECPRQDCEFKNVLVERGSALDKALRGDET